MEDNILYGIGDRLVVRRAFSFDDIDFAVGEAGAVCDMFDDGQYGICWDDFSDVMHNCNGGCANGHGWYINVECVHASMDLEESQHYDVSCKFAEGIV